MAKKMALVPESWIHRNFQEKATEDKPKSTDVTVHHEQYRNDTSAVEDIPELLPKCYRAKAKVIVHYLRDQIKLDENQRVLYPDKTVGSHILTLMRYFVSPLVKERPLDAPKFMKLMKSVGVPDYVYTKNLTKWQIL